MINCVVRVVALVVVLARASIQSTVSHANAEEIIVKAFRGEDILWGAATAAAQVEGAWNVSGKQSSIWDDFCKSIPAMTGDTSPGVLPKQCGHGQFSSTLDVTDNFYNKYVADIDMLADMGFTSFRLSISWPRVMPLVNGRHQANSLGIKFYKDLFAKLRSRSIVPMVTLFHWDLPNDLSWLRNDVVDAFVEYADLVWSSFPEVKHWATFNEPASFCNLGYSSGNFAPGHISKKDHLVCAHHVLLAHAHAVKLYREKHQKTNQGEVGIVMDYKWAYPATDSAADRLAASRDRDFVFGIWADPIFLTGDYPQSLKDFFGSHLPAFTEDEKKLLKHSADFFGANTYGGKVAIWTNKTYDDLRDGDQIPEMYSFSPCDANSPEIARQKVRDPAFECGADSAWLWARPDSMRRYLEYLHDRYKLSTLYVTEFGCDVKNESFLPKEQALTDTFREEYYKQYLVEIARAKNNGVPVKGIYAWSLLDNFEWADGLTFRFGITYVDFKSKELTRTPKTSARWWSRLLKNIRSPTVITM